ncbi:Adenylate cyclase [hydrothermal vent metagenome]|uniref:Adenylate cyclase n=1 Tax=hydrothermal vent metagenome TaxID=652676 RepID=A0A3B0Y4S4_9ZZZZ
MAVEIERKFLLKDNRWQSEVRSSECYRQGYMSQEGQLNSVRVRATNDKAWINFKSATLGMRRLEFEYPIPIEDALQMLGQLCYQPIIEKERYFVDVDQHTWEIDVFHAENTGLVVAEIELKSETESFTKPAWLGEEVTDDKRYYNVCLLSHPFKDWDQ